MLSTNHTVSLSALLLASILVIFSLFFKLLYNLFFHPLCSYPGPWYARVAIYWSQYHVYKGDITFRVKELHERYGPVIRIGPDELSYIDPQAWKDIYGHRNGIPENPKALNADPDPAHPTIASADRQWHSMLRRLLSHAFSQKAMREQEPVIKSYIDLLIRRLQETARENNSEGTDMVRWYNFTTFDIIGHLSFAESFGCLENSEYHAWVQFIFSFVKFFTMISALRRIEPHLVGLVEYLVPARIRKERLDVYTMTNELVLRRRTVAPSYTDFMEHFFIAEKEGKLAIEDIFSNAPFLVVAGSESTATLLSGCTYYLLTHPRIYKRVVAEVRGKFNAQSEITLSSIAELEYLLAVFDETLRMYPPAANNLPRRTPPEGAMILDKWVPGNTIVGIHQYAQFRSAYNFADPDVFVPERFLETDNPKWVNDRRDALQPFSFGPRNCIGRNLAYAEMRLIFASVLWNFDLELMPGQEQWLNQKLYATWEKHPLKVKLTPVQR